jgi:UDP-3-O-[3-hydroxymyristoyl] glucosamine N-acyltransferase
VVEAAQPRLWFALAAKLLKPVATSSGVHPTASIGERVKLGENVTVGACAVIENDVRIDAGTRIDAGAVIGSGVRVGEFCHLYPRAVLYPGTVLGNWVVVHAGAVLGADGFGYVRDPATGVYTQFPQQGTLVIEDDVEIGANSTIDRGALAETRIGRGTKIDNLVHIGHNCKIGEDVILVSLTGISGSSTVGRGAVLAGQVGIGDHAHVGPGVILGGQAGVLSGKTVIGDGPGTVLWGTPARPLKQVLRELAVLARLAKKGRQGEGKKG